MKSQRGKRFIVREEYFGFTFYDRQNLKHKFVLKKEWPTFSEKNGITSRNCDFLYIREKNIRQDLLYSPIRIYYELTLKCNLHCQYCFNDSGISRTNELTTMEVLKSLDELRAANVLDIRFTGGEPLMRPDWYEIFKKAKKLGFSVSCNTNGVYQGPYWDKLASLDLEQITLSIDGRKPHHEKNRGRGTFRQTTKTLKELYKRGAVVRINVLITRASMNDVDYMVSLASKYATEINFFAVRFFGRGQELETNESISFDELHRIVKKTKYLQSKYPSLNIIFPEQPMIENSARDKECKKFGLVMCAPDGATRFNISSDGRLWPGGYLPYIDNSMSVGNIKTNNLFNVWQHSKKLEKFRKRASKLIQFCMKCPQHLKECPGSNYEREIHRKKNPGRKNPYCIYGNGPSLLIQMKNKDGQ
jgi:radical SAM protein with 4Fe4S-binding SPASM domain